MKLLRLASLIAGVMLAFNLAAESNINEVTVKVQDLSCKPIAGATVEYYSSNEFDQGAKKLKAETTGTDGVAKFAITQNWALLVARKQGMSFGGAYYFTANGSQPVVLTLDQPISISGIVVDESDKPLPDVKVAVATIFSSSPMSPATTVIDITSLGDILSTRTGSDGRFRIEGLATNSEVQLSATKSGKALVRPVLGNPGPSTLTQAGQQDVKLKMQPGGSIEGKVVIPGEGKMSEVHLALLTGSVPVRTQPRTDGSFRFEDVAAGSYRIISVFGTNKYPDWVAQTVTATVEAGQVTHDVTITAVKGGILEVAVFSKAGHKPMREVAVFSTDQNGFSYGGGTTGEDGLEQRRLPQGHYSVSANKAGMQSQEGSVDIEEGQTNRVELELAPPPQMPPPPQVAGTVRDTNGVPVAGIEVKVYPSESAAKTDANGRYEVKAGVGGVGPGATPFVIVRDRDRNLAAAKNLEEGTDRYDLQLAPALVFSGRVLDEQGKPLTNAVVNIVAWSGNTGWWIDSGRLPRIDAQGRYEIGALPVGRRYCVNVSAKGYGSTYSRTEEPDSNRFEFDTITLRVADKKIAGVVVDSDNNPVKGSRVSIYGDGQPNANVESDDKGQFVINEVCDGVVNVSAYMSSGGNAYGNARVEAGDTNIVVTLRQQGGSMVPQPSRASLVGKPLPDLTAAGIPSEAIHTNKPMLICLFDPEQRPSRRAMRLLADQNDSLKQKGLTVVGVSAALTTAEALKEWKQSNPTPFAVGGVTEKNDKTQWILKTEKFPWLILTDAQGRVAAEGFELDELEEKLK